MFLYQNADEFLSVILKGRCVPYIFIEVFTKICYNLAVYADDQSILITKLELSFSMSVEL